MGLVTRDTLVLRPYAAEPPVSPTRHLDLRPTLLLDPAAVASAALVVGSGVSAAAANVTSMPGSQTCSSGYVVWAYVQTRTSGDVTFYNSSGLVLSKSVGGTVHT
ncbi:hypothetical protein ADJ73_11875 [Arsenicicoccus sp. oral taxon 190]|nr:hypothetical protein ADJ73_11875 [Arsenicicoccus sp. oral taxon 190]